MDRLDNINVGHNDFIHDLSFDFYGKRVATCSSDRKIKIFSKSKGKWVQTASFQHHDAIIWKVKWAHPMFGSILASCSADKTVIIWEEKKINSSSASTSLHKMENEDSKFLFRAKLTESKESVEDIKFAPKHIGLTLAAASAEGVIRIYEAPDIMNLQVWRQTGEIQVNQIGLNCISWNKNVFDAPMIAVGSKDASSSFLNKNAMKVQQSENNKVTVENTNIDVGPDEKYLSIYVFKDSHWTQLAQLSHENSSNEVIEHKASVNDISWSQLNGRSYHLVSSCGKDGVIVWYLKFAKDDNGVSMKILDSKFIYQSNQTIWKCSFNLMGTLLAFSGQDNKVRICKGGYDKSWNIVEEFQEEDVEENGQDDGMKQIDYIKDRMY